MQTTTRLIAFILFVPLLAAAVLVSSCSSNGSSGGGGTTISGSVNDTGSHPVVALFDASSYQFHNDTLTLPVDQVASVSGGSAPYIPLETATISGGNYTITLPAGTSGAMYYLVAWDDATSNGEMDSGETGYFPVKSFPQGSTAMTSIAYVSYMGLGEYAAEYSTGGTFYIEGFSIVGTSGYDFTIR